MTSDHGQLVENPGTMKLFVGGGQPGYTEGQHAEVEIKGKALNMGY